MKTLILALSMFFTNNAVAYVDFSGIWTGSCLVNGQESPRTTVIDQQTQSQITIDQKVFDLIKPTVSEIDDVYNGAHFREITVYDFKWNAEFTEIQTSAKWLGWYRDQSGSWSGEGTGRIFLRDGFLNTERQFSGTFGSRTESCKYTR